MRGVGTRVEVALNHKWRIIVYPRVYLHEYGGKVIESSRRRASY